MKTQFSNAITNYHCLRLNFGVFFQNLKGCVILTEIIKKNLPESRNLGESEKNHRIVSDNGTTAYLYVTE